ncbi:RNA polymerase sigma factor [bacterium]|nr:RNA polymerase sigma factor [bacterium]
MDEAAVRAQLEQHQAVSYGWALSCCARDPDGAADILQATYLKILQGRARYDGRSSFKTWLFAVIRLTAADDRRRHWLRRLRLAEYQRQREPDRPEAERGAGLDRSERARAFQRALGRLPPRQREVLHLAFYQDLSLQEAALVMGVSVGSARTHYERGKANLRKRLEQSEHIDEYRRNRERTETALP